MFTLPKALSRLALGNRRQIYSLLFRASWQAIEKTVREEQGYEAAAALVLHTWNQRLEAHAHVHALIPGGGPSLTEAEKWKTTQYRGLPTAKYLVDAKQLRRDYRNFFLAGLRRLYLRGELKLEGDFAGLRNTDCWQQLISKLESTEWVAYIQPPPHEACKPQHVVRYFGRYLTGGPISDRRLIRASEDEVVFWAREGTETGGTRRQTQVKLSSVEFVRRWCLHILPKGYVKTRRYGGWSNKHQASYLARCLELLGKQTLNTHPTHCDSATAAPAEEADKDTGPHCPECGQNMHLLDTCFKPSWASLRSLGHWPLWYHSQLEAKYQDSS